MDFVMFIVVSKGRDTVGSLGGFHISSWLNTYPVPESKE